MDLPYLGLLQTQYFQLINDCRQDKTCFQDDRNSNNSIIQKLNLIFIYSNIIRYKFLFDNKPNRKWNYHNLAYVKINIFSQSLTVSETRHTLFSLAFFQKINKLPIGSNSLNLLGFSRTLQKQVIFYVSKQVTNSSTFIDLHHAQKQQKEINHIQK